MCETIPLMVKHVHLEQMTYSMLLKKVCSVRFFSVRLIFYEYSMYAYFVLLGKYVFIF